MGRHLPAQPPGQCGRCPGAPRNKPGFCEVFSPLRREGRTFPCVFKTMIVIPIYFKFLKCDIKGDVHPFRINLKARTKGETSLHKGVTGPCRMWTWTPFYLQLPWFFVGLFQFRCAQCHVLSFKVKRGFQQEKNSPAQCW